MMDFLEKSSFSYTGCGVIVYFFEDLVVETQKYSEKMLTVHFLFTLSALYSFRIVLGAVLSRLSRFYSEKIVFGPL